MFGPSRKELYRQNERERLRHERVEQELRNQLMYLTGRTWMLPPSDETDDDADEVPVYMSALDLPLDDEEG